VFLSNDGHGDLPKRQIEDGLARGALVHCGFDNDKGGAALWEQVKEAYPRAEAIERERPPAGAKDWNDALRAQSRQEERAEGHTQEREQNVEQGHGRGGGMGSGDRERDDTPGHRR